MGIISSVKSAVSKVFNKPSPSSSSSSSSAPAITAPQSTPSGPRIVNVATGAPVGSAAPPAPKSSGGSSGSGGSSRSSGSGGSSGGGSSITQSLASPSDLSPSQQFTPASKSDIKSLLTSQQFTPASKSDIKSSSTSKTISSQLSSNVIAPSFSRGTRTDLAPKTTPMTIYAPGTIYNSEVGTPTKDKRGNLIRTFETLTIGEDFSSRSSTKEERDLLGQAQASQSFKETFLSPVKGKVGRGIGEIAGTIGILSREKVVDEKPVEDFFAKGGKTGKFVGGVTLGLIPKTKGEIVTTGLFAGGGLAIGGASKLGALSLSKVPKYGALLSKGFKVTSTGLGIASTGIYAGSTALQIASTKSYSEKGSILGKGIREAGAFGLGFGAGKKAGSISIGLLETRGRSLIPLGSMTRQDVILGNKMFPTAPQNKQLGLFKATATTLPKELTGGKPGGFHVTPEKFFGKGKDITPTVGTSELPGLYVSSEASIYFSKLLGKGYKILPTFKSITSGDRPAIAFLQPKGFRESGYGLQSNPVFEGQRSFKGKFAYFKQPAKEGFIDVPKMKTEIEGIARIDAGKYSLVSDKFYTEVKGIRVPIDVYQSKGGILGGKGSKNVPSKKTFKSKDYSPLEKSSLIESFSGYPLISSTLRSSKGRGISSLTSGSGSSILSSSSSKFSSINSLGSSRSIGQSSLLSSLSTQSYPINFRGKSSSTFGTSYTAPSRFSSIISPLPSPSLFLASYKVKSPSLFGSFSPKYTASLTATSFNITGVVPKRFRKGVVDPFSRRVIARIRKRKR